MPTVFFEDETFSGISAIVYSAENILNSPRDSEDMGEDLVIVHNPLAANPLPQGFFPFGSEYRLRRNMIMKIRGAKSWKNP